MLKKRIIPVQLLIGGRLVKTIKFDKYRNVGNPVTSSKIYNDTDADELIFLNIDRTNRTVEPMLSLIESVSEVCFMPLALGGGIRSLQDAEKLIKNGADKVVINSCCYQNPGLITEIAEKFGNQAVVVSIDARYNQEHSKFAMYSDCGRTLEPVALEEHLERVVAHGAGEIMINSIDRDGTMEGYDIELLKLVSNRVGIPVIACGGAGKFEHLKRAFLETRVSAVACGSLFNFGDNNPLRAKSSLSNYNIPFKVI